MRLILFVTGWAVATLFAGVVAAAEASPYTPQIAINSAR